jgi:hypothetical protein
MEGMVGIVLGTALASAGAVCLHAAWKQKDRPVLIGGGWSLLALAAVVSLLLAGDRGLAAAGALVLTGIMLAMLLPGWRRITPVTLAAGNGPPQEPSDPTTPGSVLYRVALFLLAGPVAGAAGFFTAALVFEMATAAGVHIATAAVLAIILAIIGWGALAVAILMDRRPIWRLAYGFVPLAISLPLTLS